jgi:hypothetical protein
MTLPLQTDRLVLPVPHTDLRLADGRRLRRWDEHDPRRPLFLPASYLDFDGWSGPKRMIVIATIDDSQHGALLHVSVSYQDRDPTWADLKMVKAVLFGDEADAMLPMPREADFTHGLASIPWAGVRGAPGGADSHVFQIIQMPVRWGQG